MKRIRLIQPGGNYFSSPKKNIKFFSSGSTLLDLALGGGWAEGRISNIIGNKCLSGDTLITAKRGVHFQKMKIKALYNRVKGAHFNLNDKLETFLVADI